jgi:hypothetical protein
VHGPLIATLLVDEALRGRPGSSSGASRSRRCSRSSTSDRSRSAAASRGPHGIDLWARGTDGRCDERAARRLADDS